MGDAIEKQLKSIEEMVDSAPKIAEKDEARIDPNNFPITTPNIVINRVFEPILAKDLSTLPTVAIEWVVEGLLAKGNITLLGAREKMGKTTLIKGLLKSLATGELFVGQSAKQSKVLMITEENAGHWARRLDDLGLANCESIWFIPQPFNSRLKTKAWENFIINDVSNFCAKNEIETLIIDTISPIWPVLNENDAAEVQTALLPLISIAKQNIAVLPIHHFSKAGGLRGSTVLGAVPDILLDFTKPQGDEESRRRVLKCRSRFEESPEQLLLEYDNNEYTLLGTPQNVAKNERISQVKEELLNHTNGATVQEIIEGWKGIKKPSRSMLRIYLKEMLFTGAVSQIGEKEIRGGKADIYQSNPVNSNNYQGNDNYPEIEAKNPVNFDAGSIQKMQLL